MMVLVGGGGLAGAAAACLLGAEATLIERETGPHDKICGEFISWEAQAMLRRLGVDAEALGAAPIDAVRLVHGGTVVRSALPGRGMGLSRRVLDEAVLAEAARRGATIRRGAAIRRLLPHGFDVDGMGRLEAGRVLLATGKHDLRDGRRRGTPAPLIGLKMAYELAPEQRAALAGHVEIVLFPGGYAGLQPIERGRANLCLLIGRRAFDDAGATWPGVIATLKGASPHLAARLYGAREQMARPAAIAGVPYGFLHRPIAADPGSVFRLGDQMAVIPSFSGDGMAIALHTAFAAAAHAGSADSYHQQMRRDLAGQLRRASALHRLGLTYPGALIGAVRAWPGALAWVARLTRVPGPAVLPAAVGARWPEHAGA